MACGWLLIGIFTQEVDIGEKKTIQIATGVLALTTAPIFAHHAAEGIVDEEVYEMIDTLVADTPHATMTIDDLAMTITTTTMVPMQKMIEEGLLTYTGMLDGDVSATIEFNDDRSVKMTIVQE